LFNSQKALRLAYEKLKATQQEYTSSGGKLTAEEKAIEKPEMIIKEQQINPWKSGTFYLFTFLVIVGVIALLLLSFPWHMIGFAVIAALLLLVVIGALQFRNDKNLGEESFLKLMLEVLKQIPFLKKAN
jgi:Flp pilus assembly protein TadB